MIDVPARTPFLWGQMRHWSWQWEFMHRGCLVGVAYHTEAEAQMITVYLGPVFLKIWDCRCPICSGKRRKAT